MKNRLVTLALAIALLTLISCAAPQTQEAPEPPPVLESTVPPPPASSSTEAAPLPSVSPIVTSPPSIPEEERRYVSTPSLIKLEPYIDGSYTDGVNTFIFNDDGTVLWNDSTSGPLGRGTIRTFEKKDIKKPLDKAALMETDEYKAVCERVSGLLIDDNTDNLYIAHKDGDTWYLYYDYPAGGGSGESYWIDDRTVFVKISAEGEFMDFGALKAAHIVWHDGYFYYIELVSGVLFTPGIGKVMRVDMDGKNRKVIVDEPAFGTIQVIDGRVYYTSLADGRAYSVDLDGNDKTPVSEQIVPVYHRVGLEFYEDVIISRYWNHPGYTYSYFTIPSEYTTPAIMDVNERNLITFPPELRGDGAYEVINWGGEESYYEEYEYDSGRTGMYFLFLKSNYDDAYWVYEKWGFYDSSPSAFEWARDEWAEKAG